MAIKKEVRKFVTNLILSGYPISDLSKEYSISRATLYKWKKKAEDKLTDEKDTIEGIKKQLSLLSKRKPTEANSRKIAMLSKALANLTREKNKKEKASKLTAPIITIKNDEAKRVREWALKEAGLFEYQREFLSSDEQFRLVLKSRQIGFSYVAALDALIGALEGRNQLFLSASEEQALILMRYLEMWAEKTAIELKGDTHTKKLPNGTLIKALANNFRTVQGFTGDIWMDEFAWYPNPKKIWHAFVPSIGAIKGRLTILSTPFEENSLFHDIYKDESKYFMFKRFTINIYRAIEDGLEFDLETMRALFDAETWASAYECQFVDDESSLFSISLIKSCVDEKLRYHTVSSSKTIWFGYDIGRVKDSSALAGVVANEKGIYELVILELLRKSKFDEQKEFLKTMLQRYPLSQLRIDKTGLGANLSENIQDMFKSRVKGVHFTASIKEYMSLNLKKMFEDKTIKIPNDPLLIADIHSIKRKAGAKGFLYDSERNSHGHADRYWALALATSSLESGIKKKRSGGVWIV